MAVEDYINNRPIFPITVIFYENDKMYTYTYDNQNEMECDLEWFDSKDKDVAVKDSQGRLINLKIEALKIITFELRDKNAN